MQSAHDTGVLSWVTSGRCDLVADIRFPREASDLDLSSIVADIVDEIGSHLGPSATTNSRAGVAGDALPKDARIPGRQSLSKSALEVPKGWSSEDAKSKNASGAKDEAREMMATTTTAVDMLDHTGQDARVDRAEISEGDKIVSIDLDIRFKDLKASVPVSAATKSNEGKRILIVVIARSDQYFTSDLSYVNNALIRPIVAFINSNKTLIPIRCHIDLTLNDFDGSWTTFDVGLLDRLSEQVSQGRAMCIETSILI